MASKSVSNVKKVEKQGNGFFGMKIMSTNKKINFWNEFFQRYLFHVYIWCKGLVEALFQSLLQILIKVLKMICYNYTRIMLVNVKSVMC